MVAHIHVECSNNSCGMDVGDVVVHTAEPLYVLAEVLSIPLGDHLQIAGLVRELVATLVSANKMMA